MQAIITKYHGPTNSKGSRISAQAAAGKVFVHYDHALNIDENHAEAARNLLEKLGWDKHSDIASGTLPNGDYCHVLIAR